MKFRVERLSLTDECGRTLWPDGLKTTRCCELSGTDAANALTSYVENAGVGLRLAFSTSYANGEALIIVTDGATIFALRAVPSVHLVHS
jgi:hypothetical protein